MKKLFLLLFAILPTMLFADNVSQEKAQTIAEQFFASSRSAMKYSSSSSPSLRMIWDGESATTRSASAPAFYVFNNESGRGFVIVSGDDRTTSPILGYSFDQNFEVQNMPENLRNWMSGIRSEINEGREQNIAATRAAEDNWAKFEYNDMKPIKLMETALWDQRSPYNSELPLGYVTGCPATAIAIIMRYHQWPEKGVGVIPESNDRVGEITLGHTYDWNNMPLNYTGSTKEQDKQVGILMRDIGALIRTQYGSGTAGANPEETLPQLLPIYMRYNKSTIKSLFKKQFSDAEWHTILQKELNENRPILYGGYSSGGGHQFVLDGYAEKNYYHVNWGWSGVSNGYYLLSGMNPPEQGAGGSSSLDGFTMKQDAIIGIQPDPENEGGGFFDLIVYKPVSDTKPYGMSTTASDFEQGKKFQVSIKDFQNKGSRKFGGKIAIAHFAEDGTLKSIISSKEIDYSVYQLDINDATELSVECTIKDQIENGDYISGVFKFENPAEWTQMHNGYLGNDKCVEKIELKGGDVPPTPVAKNQLKVTVGHGGSIDCNGQKITGVVTIDAEPNQTFEIFINPDNGYKVSKLLFNGNDYTAFVRNTNRYVTPKISSNSTLEVQFEKTGEVLHKLEITSGEGGKVTYNGEDIVNSSKTVEVVENKNVTITVVPNEGYKVAAVMYNDNDVTAELIDNAYTTPAITADAKISVAFEVVSGISDAQAGSIRIYAIDGTIVVEGAEGMIDIYTMDGAKVKSVNATSATMQISVKAGNAYIIRVAGRTFKISL